MRRIREEKGSITLFVLISIMFFVIVLVGLYVNSNYKVQKQNKELKEIEEKYQVENIDDLYNKIVKVPEKNSSVSNFQELQQKLNDENEDYIVLENDIETNSYLIINRTVTIDLNGFTYLINNQETNQSSIIITGENIELTIKDSGKNGNGAIVTTSIDENKKLISIENNAKLILESGAILNDDITNKSTQIIYISENSEFIMNGGTIIGKIIQDGKMVIISGKIIDE